MPTVSMTLWNTVGLWWVILHRAWKIKPKLPSSTFHSDNVSLYLITCTNNIILIFAIWNHRWLLSLINMVIFSGMYYLVEFRVELTLRAVILSESTVECLKIYHNDWPISLLTNFWKIKITKEFSVTSYWNSIKVVSSVGGFYYDFKIHEKAKTNVCFCFKQQVFCIFMKWIC